MRYKIFADYGWAFLYGGWESEQVHVMERYIRPGDTVYDLGANYGMHTLLFARLVGPTGRVYSFEPHPEIFAHLEQQIALNSFDTVKAIRKAVSVEPGDAYFDAGHHRGSGHLTSGDGALKVSVTTIDEFVFQEGAVPRAVPPHS